MNQYYIHDGKEQLGPYSIEQLKEKNINRDTPIWKDSLTAWTKAGDLEELNEILKPIPPPFVSSPPPAKSVIPQNYPVQRKKSKSLYWLIFIVVAIGIAIAVYINNNRNSYSIENNSAPVNQPKTAEEIQEELAANERSNPLKYLEVVDGTFRTNLLDETVLEGTIICTAKIAKFKDVVLEAQFYSTSNTLLKSERFTRYEVWGNGSRVTFKFKTNAPKETKKVGFKIIDAVTAE